MKSRMSPCLRPRPPASQVKQLVLGERKGAGFFGAVYVVKNYAELEPRYKRGFDGPIVAKFPHALRFLSFLGPIKFIKKSTLRELDNLRFLEKHWKSIQQSPEFPKGAAFSNGRLPVVPILSVISTKGGTALIKPLLEKGKVLFLKDIAELVEKNGGKLPDSYEGVNMEESLRDIYMLVQAIYKTVNVDGQPYSSDIRPPNLCFVRDPGLVKQFGMSKPGFALFELDQIPTRRIPCLSRAFIEGDTTFEKYRDQFLLYVNNRK